MEYQWEPVQKHSVQDSQQGLNREGYQGGPVLLELDRPTLEKQMDSIARWLGTTLMGQISFHQLVNETLNKIQEPHIRSSLMEISGTAVDHIRKVEKLFQIIGQNPYYYTDYAGTTIAKFKESIGKIEGMLGGVPGDWQMLHQLFLSNLNTLGAFAVIEQFGLLLGLPEIVNVVLPVVHQKQTNQLLIQEYMLEMASISIIYKQSI